MLQPLTSLLYVASSSHVYPDRWPSRRETGVHLVRLDLSSGALTLVRTIHAVPDCMYVAATPDGRSVIVTHVDQEAPAGQRGRVSAFAVATEDGSATADAGTWRLLNTQPTGGDEPCYVTTDQAGRWALLVNYAGPGGAGSVCVFPITAEGALGAAVTTLRHDGRSVNDSRQTCSHPHMITLTPSERPADSAPEAGALVLVPDLGIDQVRLYHLDPHTGALRPAPQPALHLLPGAGPRHVAIHPNRRWLYVINELDATVTAFRHTTSDEAGARFEAMQTIDAKPGDFTAFNLCADIHCTPSGRFLFATNRGHNSLVGYAIHAQTGQLTPLGYTSTHGDWPRSFAIDPTGTFVVVGNQESHALASFRLDPATGHLSATGHTLAVPAPGCVYCPPSPPSR